MHETLSNTIETLQDKHADCVRIVGSLALSPETSLDGYILATISLLNKQLGRNCNFFDLRATICDVVQAGYWDSNKKGGKPIIDSSLRDLEIEIIVDEIEFNLTGGPLDNRFSPVNNLVTSVGGFELTDLGKQYLASVVIP